MTDESSAHRNIAVKAMGMMDANLIIPSPDNYTVWYHYILGKDEKLVNEINKMIEQKMPFTNAACESIYRRFFGHEKDQNMASNAAIDAQNMLQDVLKAVANFSGETENYNKGLDDYIETISKDYENVDIKDVVKDLVANTINLKKTGEQMTRKLEDSKTEIENLRQNLEQMTQEAEKDALTGLYNRRAFERLLIENMKESQENKTDLCLLILDVDHFKKFNDTYGHLLGDEVLKIVARILMQTLKGRDVVARFGGEEFIVVLPATPMEAALKVADVIRQSIANKQLKRKDTGQNFGQITVSLGVSEYRRGADDIPKLIKRADEALYESKRLGRNRVTRES